MVSLFLPAVVCAWVAPAEAAQVQMQVDASEVHEGQTVGLSVIVSDATPRGAPELSVPPGLQLEFRTQTQSSMMVNFRMTNSVTFYYTLTALKEGSYKVAAARVQTTAGTLLSDPVTVTVGPRAADGLNDLVSTIGTEVAWVGQLLLYKSTFTTDQPRVTPQWHAVNVDGVTTDPGLDPVTSKDALLQDGKPITSLRLLYPIRFTKAGKLTLPGEVLEVQVPVQRQRQRDRFGGIFDELNGFTDITTQVYTSKPLTVNVRPLPTEGQPAGFKGLVGQFRLTAKPSSTSVNVGDTVTLSVDLEGDGSLAGITLPPLSGEGFRVYDDQPVSEARIEGDGIVAHASFKRALVPQTPGTLEVPPVEIPYFDPVKGAYAVARSEPLTLHVGGTAGNAQVASFATGDARPGVDALADDILPVRTDARLGSAWSGRWAWLPVVPGALALVVQGLAGWRPRRTVAARRYDFADLPAEPEARLAGLERIFRERVGAALGMAPEALHGEDLARLGGLAAEAEAVYRELERLRYGGADGGLPEATLRSLVEKLR